MSRFPRWMVFAGLTLTFVALLSVSVWVYDALLARPLQCASDDVRLQCQIGLAESETSLARERRTSGYVDSLVVNAPLPAPLSAAPLPATGFAPQTRLGFTVGDQWEPATTTAASSATPAAAAPSDTPNASPRTPTREEGQRRSSRSRCNALKPMTQVANPNPNS